MAADNWDEIIEVVYREGKLVRLEDFKPLYVNVFENKEFYVPGYEFDSKGELVGMNDSNAEVQDDL